MTVAELNEELQIYIAARNQILHGGQSVKLGETVITRANLPEIEKHIAYLRTCITRATRGALVRFPRVMYGR